MPHLTLLALPRSTLSSIIFSIDVFSIANRWAGESSPLFSWSLASMDGGPVEGEGRVRIQTDGSIHDIRKTDLILIPGFLPPFHFPKDLTGDLGPWLRSRHEAGSLIASVCTGSFLLAETGLLDGKTATTNWAFAKAFQKRYPDVRLIPDRILTEDGGILCSGATTSLLDLCLHLIERFGSEALARQCSRILLMSPSRRSQSPFMAFLPQKDHRDENIRKAQETMETRYAEALSLDSLAAEAGMSARHFIRRFKNATGDSPLLYLQRLRIEAAKERLEKSRESVEEITARVGYENANSFRKLFRKNTGLSPREYRSQFAGRMHPETQGVLRP